MLNTEWGPHLMCQQQARPALAGYEHNRKAQTVLKQFMKGQFRHRPYTRISRAPNADEQEMTVWDYESYVPPDVSWVRWDPDKDYAYNYNHAYWCDASCSSGCNPTTPWLRDPASSGLPWTGQRKNGASRSSRAWVSGFDHGWLRPGPRHPTKIR